MLSDQERTELDELRTHYQTARAASVTVMKFLQAGRGYLSDESMRDVADYLQLPLIDLEGLATFYNLLFRKPVGDRVILLCDSVSCWMCGYGHIRDHLKGRLGIGFGETTPDNRFTLLPMVCLGDCDHAPVMMVGQELHGDLTPDKVDRLLLGAARDGGATEDV